MKYVNRNLLTFLFSASIFLNTQLNIGSAKTERLGDDDKGRATLDSIVTSEDFKPIRVLIDPGHGPYDGITHVFGTRRNGNEIDNLTEFDMTYKVATELRDRMLEDPRFNIEMTKNLNDYEEGFKNFCKENSTAINRIYPIGKITFNDGKKVDIDSLKSINKIDPKRNKDDWKKLYATFLYSQDYDILISPHFDYSGRKRINGRKLNDGEYVDSGYTIIINPHSKKYEETKKMAEILSEELSKIQNVTTTKIMNSNYSSKKIRNQKNELNGKGIALRNLAVLGSGMNPGNNSAIVIEFGHLNTTDTSYAFVKSVVDATVRSIYLSKDMPMLEEIAQK